MMFLRLFLSLYWRGMEGRLMNTGQESGSSQLVSLSGGNSDTTPSAIASQFPTEVLTATFVVSSTEGWTMSFHGTCTLLDSTGPVRFTAPGYWMMQDPTEPIPQQYSSKARRMLYGFLNHIREQLRSTGPHSIHDKSDSYDASE
jgi:hypothetical protein